MIINLVGKKYGKLKVIKRDGHYTYKNGKKEPMWLCLCECGNKKRIRGKSLRYGETNSCGCYKKEINSKSKYIHGLSNHPLFVVWSGIVRRCNDEKYYQYKHYGGRGISICDEWLDVKKFVKWGENNGYKKGLQIDRKDNDLGYFPENCRFVTCQKNVVNRRLLFDNNTSGYAGVYKQGKKWTSQVQNKNKRYYTGLFSNKIDAAIARDSLIISKKFKHKINFPQKNGVMFYEIRNTHKIEP